MEDAEEEEEEDGDEEAAAAGPSEVFLPGRQLEEDEELVVDESAYVMFHQAHTGERRDSNPSSGTGFSFYCRNIKSHVRSFTVCRCNNLFCLFLSSDEQRYPTQSILYDANIPPDPKAAGDCCFP